VSRWWTERVAEVGDAIGLGLATLLLLLAAALVAAGWYWYPAWLPWRWWPARGRRGRTGWRWRWPWQWSWGWLRRLWPWRRRPPKEHGEPSEEPVAVTADELPDLPAAALLSLADQYAAQGRYAEAVRERLRAIVRELVDAGVIENRPGWTVTELARAAGTARPPVRPPLDAASQLFSDIWYGQRRAYAAHDQRMRAYAAQVHDALATVPAGGAR
jgi:Domain of unknown function (DUF4129)